jgi:hypothetical protein
MLWVNNTTIASKLARSSPQASSYNIVGAGVEGGREGEPIVVWEYINIIKGRDEERRREGRTEGRKPLDG